MELSKKKIVQRIFAYLLAVSLALTLMSANIYAAPTNGSIYVLSNDDQNSESLNKAESSKENPLVKANPDTICNPINIGYQYQANFSGRESADAEIIRYKDDYFLFASHGTGYWYTKDFANWNYVIVTGTSDVMTEWGRFAPGVCVIGDTVYMAMSDGGSILKTDNPYDGGSWTIVGKPISNCYDPSLLLDDDGRVYCYYGNAGVGGFLPLSVQELDPNNNMARIGAAKINIMPTDRNHGFEVRGDDNRDFVGSVYNEGLYCTKYDGRYYLQYATPGTQFASYANGCYVSDSPMGPFTFCDNSPISYKPTGFIIGSGHGSLVQDDSGNWWKFDTSSISVNHDFERRLSVYPAKFDQYGQLLTNTAYLDYPMYKLTVPHNNFTDRPDWNLVSYAAKTTASSALDGHDPSKAFDESMRSWWSAETGNGGEWIEADLGKVCDIAAVQINFADQGITRATAENVRNNTWKYRYLLEFSLNGDDWFTVVDQSNAVAEPNKAQDTSHDYYELVSALKARYARLTNKGPVPADGKFAVSGLRLFGSGLDTKPDAVSNFSINRLTGAQPDDQRSVIVSWDAVTNAEGYIIRFGNKPDSLNLQYKVIGGNSARINILNIGVDYYFTVDAYNDSGITLGTVIKSSELNRLLMTNFKIYENDEKCTAIVGMFNSANSSANTQLIIAAYDNRGRLISATAKDIGILPGAFRESVISIPFAAKTNSVKAFIWNEDMCPLAESLLLQIK